MTGEGLTAAEREALTAAARADLAAEVGGDGGGAS